MVEDISRAIPMGSTSEVGALEPQVKVTKRKNRPQLSCNFCRHRKLKCNRAHPCDNCTKRGKSSMCAYMTSPAAAGSGGASNVPRPNPPQRTADMQRRLQHLESLVTSLMNNDGSTPREDSAVNVDEALGTISVDPRRGPEISIDQRAGLEKDSKSVTNSFGRMGFTDNERSYVDAAHWSSILDDITEVREYLDAQTQPEEESDYLSPESLDQSPEGPYLLSGRVPCPTKAELLAAMPDRQVVDRLVSRYFNSKDSAVIIFHVPAFQRQYEEFWADPWNTSTTWIGLLFALLGMAAFFYHRAGDVPPDPSTNTLHLMETFRMRAAQSLLLSNYTKPGPFTVEALTIYMECEYIRSPDAQASTMLLLTLAIRLAMRMGYHRDSRHFPSLSAHEGEMRRRVWAVLTQIELLGAIQLGLPRIVQDRHVDTQPPHNLFDEDFDETSAVLPPSRPESDQTPLCYTRAKARMYVVFGRIVDDVYAMQSPPSAVVATYDRDLSAAHATIPQWLCIRPLERSITDPAHVIMARYNLELLYQKARIVLHRKHLSSPASPGIHDGPDSRAICVEAAEEILRHQADLHRAVRPGGHLERDAWFLSSLSNHDFLLAAMVICLHLYHGSQDQSGTASATETTALLQALETSYGIWMEARETSAESRRACDALAVMLGKVGSVNHPSAAQLRSTQKHPPHADPFLTPQAQPLTPTTSFSAAPPATTLDPSQLTTYTTQSPTLAGAASESFLESMIDVPLNLDWDLWDRHFQFQ